MTYPSLYNLWLIVVTILLFHFTALFYSNLICNTHSIIDSFDEIKTHIKSKNIEVYSYPSTVVELIFKVTKFEPYTTINKRMTDCMQRISHLSKNTTEFENYVFGRILKNSAVMIGYTKKSKLVLNLGLHLKVTEHYRAPQVAFYSKRLSHDVREVIDLAYLHVYEFGIIYAERLKEAKLKKFQLVNRLVNSTLESNAQIEEEINVLRIGKIYLIGSGIAIAVLLYEFYWRIAFEYV